MRTMEQAVKMDGQPVPMTLEEISNATDYGKFLRMPVSEKMIYLQATADLYHSMTEHEDDRGFYDIFRQCSVKEFEEIARISGVTIPAGVYDSHDKDILKIHMQWYVNVKVYGVDVQRREREYVESIDYSLFTAIDISAGVENYECGKLTADELAEMLDKSPAEALLEYILKVIVNDPPERIKIPA